MKHRAQRRRQELAERLRQEIAAERERITAQCAARREGVMETARSEAERVRFEERDRRRTERLIKVREKDLKQRDRKEQTKRRAERAAESDDMVLAELPPELHPVWEKHKRRFRGSTKWSRAEEFLHWVEENPDEVIAEQAEAIEAATAREIAELQKAERSLSKRLAKPSKRRPDEFTYTAEELEGLRRLGIDPFAPVPLASGDVPF